MRAGSINQSFQVATSRKVQSRAPHRSYLYAMGLTEEQIHQPLVGVATCWNEAAPCNISLMRQAQAVKKGVSAARGTPREFCTITVTDGIAMGHQGMKSSLPSREVIADSVELTMRGHSYDALVGMAGCDKSLPGMMMAMVRLNIPSIFIYGGSILPGSFRGQSRDRAGSVRGRRQAFGRRNVGRGPDRTRAGRLSVGRRLRRAVHRQHHGDGVRGHRPRAALFGRRAGSLRNPRPVLLHGRRNGDGTSGEEHSPARYRDPARRWKMPRPLSPPPAARPMRRCIFRRSPTRSASSSISSTSPKSSSARPTSPISSRAAAMSPRTCSKPAAFRCS